MPSLNRESNRQFFTNDSKTNSDNTTVNWGAHSGMPPKIAFQQDRHLVPSVGEAWSQQHRPLCSWPVTLARPSLPAAVLLRAPLLGWDHRVWVHRPGLSSPRCLLLLLWVTVPTAKIPATVHKQGNFPCSLCPNSQDDGINFSRLGESRETYSAGVTISMAQMGWFPAQSWGPFSLVTGSPGPKLIDPAFARGWSLVSRYFQLFLPPSTQGELPTLVLQGKTSPTKYFGFDLIATPEGRERERDFYGLKHSEGYCFPLTDKEHWPSKLVPLPAANNLWSQSRRWCLAGVPISSVFLCNCEMEFKRCL